MSRTPARFSDRRVVAGESCCTGADLFWRATGNAVLPVLERFPDDSFRSEMVASDDKHHCERAAIVRVIEYAIVDPGRPEAEETRYRLVPTILDPAVAPVADLAAWYAERWEFEPRSTS